MPYVYIPSSGAAASSQSDSSSPSPAPLLSASQTPETQLHSSLLPRCLILSSSPRLLGAVQPTPWRANYPRELNVPSSPRPCSRCPDPPPASSSIDRELVHTGPTALVPFCRSLFTSSRAHTTLYRTCVYPLQKLPTTPTPSLAPRNHQLAATAATTRANPTKHVSHRKQLARNNRHTHTHTPEDPLSAARSSRAGRHGTDPARRPPPDAPPAAVRQRRRRRRPVGPDRASSSTAD